MELPVADVLDQLISECGALRATLERIEGVAILPFIKWELQGQIARAEHLTSVLQMLAATLNGKEKGHE